MFWGGGSSFPHGSQSVRHIESSSNPLINCRPCRSTRVALSRYDHASHLAGRSLTPAVAPPVAPLPIVPLPTRPTMFEEADVLTPTETRESAAVILGRTDGGDASTPIVWTATETPETRWGLVVGPVAGADPTVLGDGGVSR